MISSALRIIFLGMGSLLVSWAAFLFYPPFSRSALLSEDSWFSAAFAHPSNRGGLVGVKGHELAGALFQFLPVEVETVRPLENLLRRRAETSFGVLPVSLASFTAAVLAAILVRERLRFGTGYASPTVSFLAKRVAEGAILVFFLLTFSPFPLPYWTFYPALGAAALGAFGYVANLPLRL
jgi:hypothetical protein